MINFGKIGLEKKMKEINPRDIFMSLPSRTKEYSYLRDVQTEVLNQWFLKRNNKNNIIKMNTGSGKTVVSLLMLQSSLNENAGPAMYVVPDSYLVEQVISEAEKLGIRTARSYKEFTYTSGQAILVTNIQTLVNGLSVFGMRKGNDNYKIGTVVIDDIHACIESIEQQFTIEIASGSDEYKKISEILESPIKEYDDEKYFYLYTEPRPFREFILPFWIWQNKCTEIKKILVDSTNEELSFKLPLILDNLVNANCVIGAEGIEITSKFPDINKITSFENAQRRIFMSATISDDSIFVSSMGLKQEELPELITPEKANDMGERLLLFPEYLNHTIKRHEIIEQIVMLAKKQNVVVLVPSFKKASDWENVAQQILSTSGGNIITGIENLKNGHVGLTVIVNKYDGIDLPYNACRVLVIDDLPMSRNKYDTALSIINSKDKRIVRQRMHKIEQGMGRGVRSNNDYCVVIMLGKVLANTIIQENGLEYFSETTRAQYEISHQIWSQLSEVENIPSISSIFKLSNFSLQRNIDWVTTSKELLNDIKYKNELYIDNIVIGQRVAFDLVKNGDFAGAINILQELKNNSTDELIQGLLLHDIAEYTNLTSAVQAQVLLKSARKLNQYVTRPIDGIVYKKLFNTIPQAKNILNNLDLFKGDLNDYIFYVSSIIEDLKFNQGSHNRFEEAIKNIFIVLGWHSTRPEEDNGDGPDNLVALGNGNYLVIECKNEATTDFISKKDINQITGSMSWFDTEYKGNNFSATPIIIHHSNIHSAESRPLEHQRVITQKYLEKFTEQVMKFLIELNNSYNIYATKEIDMLLNNYKLTSSKFVEEYTIALTKARK